MGQPVVPSILPGLWKGLPRSLKPGITWRCVAVSPGDLGWEGSQPPPSGSFVATVLSLAKAPFFTEAMLTRAVLCSAILCPAHHFFDDTL